MCGIVGFNWEDKQLIVRLANKIIHRGPEDHGYYTDKNISLGHRRLSIIDLSEKGKQPMSNEEGDIFVVFNGEIYNFMELKQALIEKGHIFKSNTDTEVIVHAYEEYGTKFVETLWGFFAIAVYDSTKKKLILARDRVGKKPLYYYLAKDKLIFASEIKAILEFDEIKREINKEALNHFLCFRYNALPATIFSGINRLKPGTILEYDLIKKEHKIDRYWQVDNSNETIQPANEDAIKKELLSLFEDAVRRRLISDVPVGAYLSGGIDSSSVVAVMSNLNKQDSVKTFSVGFEDDSVGNELKYASQVSELFNTDHEEVLISSNDSIKELPQIVWHLDEPMSDPAVVPNYFLSRRAKKKVTVVLTGDGADELFAGYDQYKFFMLGYNYRWLPDFVRKNLASSALKLLPAAFLNKIYSYSTTTGKEMFNRFAEFFYDINYDRAKAYLDIVSIFNEKEIGALLCDAHKIKYADIPRELNSEYFNNGNKILNNLLRMDIERYLPEDLLMKPDKMCMAFAVEARSPFLDHRIIDYSFRLNPKLKLKGTKTKYILKRAMRQILPEHIIKRKKQPFVVPLDIWLGTSLKGRIKELVMNSELIKKNLINKAYADKLFSNYDASKMYYGRQLWSLVNLELWHQIFINGERPEKLAL